MPVKWILRFHPEGQTIAGQTIKREVDQCAKNLNAVKGGSWKTTLTFFKPNVRDKADAKDFPGYANAMGVSLAGHPDKYLLVLKDKRIVVEADASMQEIMESRLAYNKAFAVTYKGVQYLHGDFQVQLGEAFVEGTEVTRGFLMEIEYLPISSWQTSYQMLAEYNAMWQEALSSRSNLEGEFVPMRPEFAEYKLADQYSLQHTAVQYVMLLKPRE